jgi:hypothetical protein
VIEPYEAALILGKCSAFDQRTTSEEDAIAWSEALDLADPPIMLDDALAAVTRHFAAETRRCWPADVIAGAHRIAAERRLAARERALTAAAMEAPVQAVGDRRAETTALVDALRRHVAGVVSTRRDGKTSRPASTLLASHAFRASLDGCDEDLGSESI